MKLENIKVNVYKEFGIYVKLKDIEECQQSLLSMNSRGHDIILKFVNRKHSESLLKDENESVVKAPDICTFLKKTFVSVSLNS